MTVVLVDLDVLADTQPLWQDWLADAERVIGLAPDLVPHDRAEAAAVLDAGDVGNWRALLERFAEDRGPLYLRPAAEVSATLRRIVASGAQIAVFSDAPAELVRVALAHSGAGRRVTAVETGLGALERLRARFESEAIVIGTREEFTRLAP